MTRKTWIAKDDDGCEFKATVVIDADETIIRTSGVEYRKGDRRYSAFDGKVTASTLAELKAKVSAL